MKKTIKINFWNWWGFGIYEWNAMFYFLQDDYDFELSPDPDFLVFSNTAGRSMPHVNVSRHTKKIFFMGEIIDVNMSECDWAFGDNYIDSPRHFRMPYYVTRMLYTGTPLDALVKNIDVDEVFSHKTGFCNFLFSNTKDGERRNAFFNKLSEYKRVDAAGESMNNMGGVLPGRAGTRRGKYIVYPEKMEFLSRYKFTIAYENNRSDYNPLSGYTTEKLTEPMLANSIPIYRGNPRVNWEFNTQSFVNFDDFENEDKMIEWIIRLDQNDELYKRVLAEPWLYGNKVQKHLDVDEIKCQFRRIFK